MPLLYTLLVAGRIKIFLQISTVHNYLYFFCQNITKFPCCSCVRKKYCCLPLFPGRKRFAVPRDLEQTPPTPVCIFRRNDTTSREVAPPAEQQPAAVEHEIPVPACDFCLQSPCITFSAFKPMGRGEARITNHTNAVKTTSGSGAL